MTTTKAVVSDVVQGTVQNIIDKEILAIVEPLKKNKLIVYLMSWQIQRSMLTRMSNIHRDVMSEYMASMR